MSASRAVTSNSPPAKTLPPGSQSNEELRITGHSDLLYWWIVWLYGFICAGWTYIQGDVIPIGDKAVHIHPSPLLGISFTGLVVFVAVFTNIRARGRNAALAVACLIIVAFVAQYFGVWGMLLKTFPLLRIHMNMAFYAAISFALLVPWAASILLPHRFSYFFVRPGNMIGIRDWTGEHPFMVTGTPVIAEQPGDLIAHGFLGLRWLGFGTGDIDVTYVSANVRHTIHFKNVWMAEKKVHLGNGMLHDVVLHRT